MIYMVIAFTVIKYYFIQKKGIQSEVKLSVLKKKYYLL